MFFVAGLGCGVTAVKIFWAQSRIDRTAENEPQVYRENVRIHTYHSDDL